MHRTPRFATTQRGVGVIGIIMFILAAGVAVVGFMAASGRFDSSQSSKAVAKTTAGQVLSQATLIRTAHDRLVAENGVSTNDVIGAATSATGTGLYESNFTGVEVLAAPVAGIDAAFATANGGTTVNWQIATFSASGGTFPFTGAYLVGLTKEVCQAINVQRHGKTATTATGQALNDSPKLLSVAGANDRTVMVTPAAFAIALGGAGSQPYATAGGDFDRCFGTTDRGYVYLMKLASYQ